MDELNTTCSFINAFVENSAEAIILTDHAGLITGWNKKTENLLQIEAKNAVGLSIAKVVPAFSDACFHTFLKSALDGKGNISSKAFQISGKRIKPGFSPVIMPDTGERACLIILRETEPTIRMRFKRLIEESPIATAIYRPDGTPKFFNQAYSKLWRVKKEAVPFDFESYNIFEDEQLIELGLLPFLEKGFAGDTVEVPPIAYTPSSTSSLAYLGLRECVHVKGYIFSIKNEQDKIDEVVIVLSDITFQMQAEKILTDTHLKFQMLTVGLPGVIYELEENVGGMSTFRYISQGCYKMFGFSPEEICKDADLLEQLIHPDDLEGYLFSNMISRRNGSEWQWEGRIIVDGQEKWIEGKSNPSIHRHGKTVRYGLLMDVTEKKEVEKQYESSEERLELALQGADIGLWEWNLNERKTIFNKAWANRYGYDHQELELEFDAWCRLIHPDDLQEVKQKLYRHLNGESDYYEAEYRFRNKNGHYRWLLDKGRAMLRDHNGRVTKAAGTYLDIDEKKNVQLLIQRNEQLFTQLFDNSPLGIVLLNEQQEALKINQGFKDMFGYAEEEVIGKQLNDVIVPPDFREEALEIDFLSASGRVARFESKRNHKDGHLVPVIIYGHPVTLDSKTIGIYGIYVDITERKKAEDELQVRNSELDHFVYKVSHDLRAPLSSILGLINLTRYHQNRQELIQYMKMIEDRVKQLDLFINDVLSHSKNLKLSITIDPVDFNTIIDQCFEELSYLPKANNIRKDVQISGVKFYCDRWRISEIFRNLISNSIKYSNSQQDDPFIIIDIKVTDEQATIVLEDNGIGIERKTQPRIFDMFYRATDQAEGSGIGLYIVKNAIEKLGGEVTIESEADRGTTFNITIPNAKEAWFMAKNEK